MHNTVNFCPSQDGGDPHVVQGYQIFIDFKQSWVKFTLDEAVRYILIFLKKRK
jgi:hypothetical protein